ncbi:MAG: undecaprenyl-diphosphate phosphatase [Marinilabiliales bacterium]
MSWFEALILGLIQGLTEFLPVSSSGHLELGKAILNIETTDNLTFTIIVHFATVLSTIVVFRKDLYNLFKGLFLFKWNEETIYITKLIVSMIPVGFVGFFMKDTIESFFGKGNVSFVGFMLIITSLLLAFTYLAKPKEKKITFLDSFIIGIAQAVAVLPGISRSGATIATGILLGNNKKKIARFSFLMVLIPIIGENILELLSNKNIGNNNADISYLSLLVGFTAAFISGLLACKWMISLVSKGKLIYFAIYCFIIGSIAVLFGFQIF